MAKHRRVFGCLAFIGLLLLSAGLLVGREVYLALTATPGSAVDYHRQLIRLAEGAQPPGRDGWADLLQAVDAMRNVQDELGRDLVPTALKAMNQPGEMVWESTEFTPEQCRASAEEIVTHLGEMGAWEALSRLAASRRAVRDTTDQDVEKLLDVRLPESGGVRVLAQATVVRMRLAHERGDDPEVAEAFEHALTLARVMASQPLLIDRLIANSISATAIRELQHELLERVHAETALRRMMAAMRRRRCPGSRWPTAVSGSP